MNFKAAALSWSIVQSFVLAGCAAAETARSDLPPDGSQVDAGDVFERDGGVEDASASDGDSGRHRGPRADAGVEPKSTVEDIWAGPAMTCARVNRSGVVTTKCWGDNRAAQLGRGEASATPAETFVPQAIQMDDSSQIVRVRSTTDNAYRRAQTCIILRDKTLKCWGSRWDSIDPLTGLVTAPPEAPLLTGVEDVRMGDQFSCARLETSNVACWGANRDGQLGLGTRDNTIHELPVTIPNFTADEIALSDDLACGRKGGDVSDAGSESARCDPDSWRRKRGVCTCERQHDLVLDRGWDDVASARSDGRRSAAPVGQRRGACHGVEGTDALPQDEGWDGSFARVGEQCCERYVDRRRYRGSDSHRRRAGAPMRDHGRRDRSVLGFELLRAARRRSEALEAELSVGEGPFVSGDAHSLW
ncbi:MAG: hypothetical protein K0S65_3409 [Labilithrix sp.]|nr:hypothetical protein [Labilithrix sp.]